MTETNVGALKIEHKSVQEDLVCTSSVSGTRVESTISITWLPAMCKAQLFSLLSSGFTFPGCDAVYVLKQH